MRDRETYSFSCLAWSIFVMNNIFKNVCVGVEMDVGEVLKAFSFFISTDTEVEN